MTHPLLAKRLDAVKPSETLAVNNRALQLKAEGRDIINLGVGEPDFETPTFVREAAKAAMDQGKTKYTSVDGTPELKAAICRKFQRENTLAYVPNQISVGTGGKQVLFNALMATLSPGDEVIIPAPFWTSYPEMVLMSEGTPVIVSCPASQRFKLTPAQLEEAISPNTKWLILNSPSNPTGVAYTKQELQGLAAVLAGHPHVHILSDDIYEHIVYDGFTFHTIAEVAPHLYDRTLTVNGVSKAYAMTGWRIGYGAGPQPLIKAMSVIQSQSTSNPSSISQAAATAALDGDQGFLQEWRRAFQERRDHVARWLNEMPGISCDIPEGAFYVFPCAKGLLGKKTPQGDPLHTTTQLATYFLEATNIAVVPGSAFGAPNHFRISYATSLDLLRQACQRMKEAIEVLS